MSEPVSVLLADDHALVLESLVRWFEQCADIRIVAHVSDGDEAVKAALEHKPQVVVLDIDMPGRDCFDAAQAIRDALPETKVLFLSALLRDHFIEKALAVRASGYITKGRPPQVLADAIRAAAAGQVYFSPEVQARVVIDDARERLVDGGLTRGASLSRRELEVLRHVARGLTQKEIAEVMQVSPDTVHTHTANLMRKLRVHSRVELATYAMREGLMSA